MTNGANQSMPDDLGLDWAKNINIIAGINASTYLAAAIVGCWLSDPVQSKILGRRGAIFGSACVCFIAALGAACSHHWKTLLVWRAFLGVGLGMKASVTPIFGAEVAPSHLRGMLVMNWQLFNALGIFLGFSADWLFYWVGVKAWRTQIGSACLPAAVLMALIWTIPESPRWLLKKGRAEEAFVALCSLRPTPLQAAIELFYAHAQIQLEIDYMGLRKPDEEHSTRASASTKSEDKDTGSRHSEYHEPIDLADLQKYPRAVAGTHYLGRIRQLFWPARIRRATIAAGVVMFGQQLCGMFVDLSLSYEQQLSADTKYRNVLAFYSTVFMQPTGGLSPSDRINAVRLSVG